MQRNVSSQYYYRLLSSQHKELVEREMLQTTAPLQTTDANDFIKNPVVGEFLGFLERQMNASKQPRRKRELYNEIKRLKGGEV